MCEIELELKRGSSAEQFRLAQRLSSTELVMLGVTTKADRDYELLTGKPPSPAKSGSIGLSHDLSTQAAFKVIARACLHQLLANLPALRAPNPGAPGTPFAKTAPRAVSVENDRDPIENPPCTVGEGW